MCVADRARFDGGRSAQQPPPVEMATRTKPKLLDQLSEALRSRHYSRRTEQTYCMWVKRFIYFHHIRHPAEMGEPEINAFLTHLAVQEKVSASTQNQALSAILFLYRHVIGREVGDLGEVIRARKPTRLPVVMTREEVKAVLANLTGDKWLMASLMYGAVPPLARWPTASRCRRAILPGRRLDASPAGDRPVALSLLRWATPPRSPPAVTRRTNPETAPQSDISLGHLLTG